MSDGRHFDNGFLHSSASNHSRSMKFVVPMLLLCDEKSILSTSKRRPAAILKIFFGYIYISVSYCLTNSNVEDVSRIAHVHRHMTTTANFENSRWRTAANLKMAISPLSQPRITRFRLSLVCRCVIGS